VEEVPNLRSHLPSLALACALAAAPPAWAVDEADRALTKEEERARFHPRRTGMDAGTRLLGYARRVEMEQGSPLHGLRFRNVGPEVQGGRIVDIEGPAAHPDSLIVAYATGGIWRSDNRGGSWTPLFEGQSPVTIGDVALGDGDGTVIYVGSGEANSQRTSYAGTGVFRSTDGGRTWKNVGLTDSHHIGRVLVDRRDPRTVYVAAMGHLYTENAERGVFKTTDGGDTWTRVLFVDERTGAIDLVQDPANPDVLYASLWDRARTAGNFLESGTGSGVWKTTDAGKTWSRLAGGLPSGPGLGRIGLAVAASRPQTLYALIDNQARRPDTEPPDEETPPGEITPRRLRALSPEAFARLDDATVSRFLRRYDFPKALKPRALKRDVKAGKITMADLVAYVKDANRDLFENPVVQAELYRSDDGGASWRKTHEGRLDKVYYSYGYYFGGVAVDPTDPERIYVAGLPILGSRDGGRTFSGLDRMGVHVDEHAIYVDPRNPRRVLIGNDGGLNVSYDYGQTWARISNLPVGQFTTLALDNGKPYRIIGGLQDNGVMRGPSTYHAGAHEPDTWKEILGGDGSAVAVDPKDDNVVYAAYQFGNAFRLNLKTGERQRVRPRPELSADKKEKPLRYNWVTPFILSPHSRDILYFGANRLYRSFDRGDTWTAISPDLTSDREQGDVPFGTITSLSESSKRFGLIWAGTDEGKVWLTRDGGASWTDASKGLAPARWVTRVVASTFDEGTAYVTQSGYRDDDFAPYVFRTTDYGRTWQSLAAGLPAEPVNVIREDGKARHLLYLGTDGGAFVSLDQGQRWIPLTGGLPRVAVHDLQVHAREGDVVLATHGRSVYLAQAAPLRKLTAEVQGKALHAFPIPPAQADLRRGYGEHPYITWFRVDPTVPIAFWARQAGQPVRIVIKDENGSVWQELTATSLAGYNAVDYDLGADRAKADAAEAVARGKALEKKKAAAAKDTDKDKDKDKPADEAEDEEDEDTGDKPASGGGSAVLDEDLHAALADPLRAGRLRFLPAGRYTVEITAGADTARTRLTVKPPREQPAAADDDAVID
jgi:photosystem II stability/assembly factor-like uncharacterized protein